MTTPKSGRVEMKYESKVAKRFNEIGFFKYELETIRYWAELAKIELQNKESSSFHLDYYRALNIAFIVTYAKFFSSNKGFGFKPNIDRILNKDEIELHYEICEVRNKAIAHIDSGQHFSSVCTLEIDANSGMPTSVFPINTFSFAYGEERTEVFISLIDKVYLHVSEQYQICAKKIFSEYQNKT